MLHVRLIHHAVTNRLPQQQVLSSLHSVKKTATHKKFSQCSFLRSFKTLLHTNKPDTQTKSIQSHIMFLPNQFFTRSSFRATHTRYLGSSALRNDKEEEKAADCVVAQIRSPFLQKTDDDENKSPTLLQRLESFLVKHFGKHTIEAPDGFNRWLVSCACIKFPKFINTMILLFSMHSKVCPYIYLSLFDFISLSCKQTSSPPSKYLIYVTVL